MTVLKECCTRRRAAWVQANVSDIRQPLTTVGETTGSFPGRIRKGPPGNQGDITFRIRQLSSEAGPHSLTNKVDPQIYEHCHA